MTTTHARKGSGADTGNPGHFASTERSRSTIDLHAPSDVKDQAAAHGIPDGTHYNMVPVPELPAHLAAAAENTSLRVHTDGDPMVVVEHEGHTVTSWVGGSEDWDEPEVSHRGTPLPWQDKDALGGYAQAMATNFAFLELEARRARVNDESFAAEARRRCLAGPDVVPG